MLFHLSRRAVRRSRLVLLSLVPAFLLLVHPAPSCSAPETEAATPAPGGGSLWDGTVLDITAGLLSGDRADTIDVQDVIADSTLVLRVDGDTLRLPYISSRPLGQGDPSVTRAAILIHGTLRNADDYYATLVDAAAQVPGSDSTAILIAPQFLAEQDVMENLLPSQYLFWAYMGWRQGDNSLNTVLNPRPRVVSSFAATDTLLRRLAETFPNLEQIVLAGHSAGGQFQNRYAAGTDMADWLAQEHGIQLRFIVSNPSTYIYFDELRWVEGTFYDFALPGPGDLEECPEYNDYKYGLENLNPYMNQDLQILQDRYSSRDIVYLLGEQDTNPMDWYLDKSCPALLQGEHRLERGIVYTKHLMNHFGPGIMEVHALSVVPGVGHDNHGMFTSQCGIYHLFGYGECPLPPVAQWEEVTPASLIAPTARIAAWGDFDLDGDPDLYLAAVDGGNVLARNDGDGVFTDVTVPPLDDEDRGMAVNWIDFDGDGLPDLHLVNWRGTNRLFRNTGSGQFEDATTSPLDGSGDYCEAAWTDYDLDGDLDVYLTRMNNDTSQLLRNDGPSGFTDATTPLLALGGDARDASWADYDDDGDPDLFVCIGNNMNRLFRNDGGEFVDATLNPLNDAGPSSGCCWGDYDNDGDLDLYVVNRGIPNHLLRNEGGGLFTDVTCSLLGDFGPGRSATWADVDNDGLLDLYLVNNGSPNRLFHNEDGCNFTDTAAYPLNDGGNGYGAAFADMDGDGDLDLFMTNDMDANRLVRNNLNSVNRWLEIELRGVESNTLGIGARVRAVAGGVSRIREVGVDSAYECQNSTVVHFGLGSSALVDTLEVRWPSGLVQTLTGVGTNLKFTLVESASSVSVPEPPPDSTAPGLVPGSPYPNPFRGETRLEFRLSDPGPVEAGVFDPEGRCIRTLRIAGGPGAGDGVVVWDGRDARGRRAPAGIYFLRLQGDSGVFRRPVVLLD